MHYITKTEFTRQARLNRDDLDFALTSDKPNEAHYAFGSMTEFRDWRINVQFCFEEIEI